MLGCHSIVPHYLGILLLLWVGSAGANEADILLLPTRVETHQAVDAERLRKNAAFLDHILLGAAPDLGLQPQRLARSTVPSEEELPKAASRAWAVLPTLKSDKHGLSLRLAAVAPATNVLLVRVQRLNAAQLEVKALVMLQELVTAGTRDPTPPTPSGNAVEGTDGGDLPPPSGGRAVLALNAAAFGAYTGYTVHRASRSSDSRLLYPLTALGAGLGLGGAMLVSDEWNVTQGSAWYLSAGLVWPGLAGLALGEAYDGRAEYRHLYGLLGAASGLTLATTVVSLAPTSPGHAALAHSGGAFGTLFGGLTQALLTPDLKRAPLRGMGYGAALGVLVTGALVPALHISASRVVFIDLSASLGALTGAALATPLLLVGDDPSAGRSRFWFASVLGGTLLGGTLGTWITRHEPNPDTTTNTSINRPYIGLVGFTEDSAGKPLPLFGAELTGSW